MENRIFFGTKGDTISFFNDVKTFGNFSSFKELYPLLKIRHGDFYLFKNGKRSLRESQFNTLFHFLPSKLQEKYTKKIEFRKSNWGQVAGGKTTAKNHPEIFEKGRLTPKNYPNRIISPSFDLNQPLSEELCEFLGAFSGDGFTNKYGRHYQIGFAGDKRYDNGYYHQKIIPITNKFFNIHSCYSRTRENGIWFNFHSKSLFEMLTRRFQMPAGVKFDKVLIPDEVMQNKRAHKIAFIRGVFDTDGCVFFDKRKIYKEPYMRVDICMYNIPILTQINQILTEVGIESKVLGNGKHLHVTSKENVRKFFEIVGSSNERHIVKIRQKYSDFDEWNPAKPMLSSIPMNNY
jgi:hypothetical protein